MGSAFIQWWIETIRMWFYVVVFSFVMSIAFFEGNEYVGTHLWLPVKSISDFFITSFFDFFGVILYRGINCLLRQDD